jgi:Tfp pilus assembly protein PilF
MADIFISYARENSESANRLAAELEARGWSVFWDRQIPAGRRFSEFISEKLATAKCVITLWSEAAVASDWVQEEAEEAKQRNVLVPALIEQVDPPWGFRRIQAADLVQWRGESGHEGFRQLLRDIERYAPVSRAAAPRQGSVEGSTATPESKDAGAVQRPSMLVAAKQERPALDKAQTGSRGAATETQHLNGQKAAPETFEREPAQQQVLRPQAEIERAAAAAESVAPTPLLDRFSESPEWPRRRQQNRFTYLKLAVGGVALAGLLAAYQVASWRSARLAAKASFEKGVSALRDQQYTEAVQFLTKSLDLDTNLPTARMYLAEAYLRQSLELPKNGPRADTALRELRKVLQEESRNGIAIRSIALLLFSQNKYTDARQWYEKALEVNPRDKIALYSLGAIAWNEAYPAVQSARSRSGMASDEPRPIRNGRVRGEVRAKYLESVKAGMDNLSKALEVDKDYLDAIAYQSLTYRVLGDMAADTAEYRKYTDIADDLATTVINARLRASAVAEKVDDFWTGVPVLPPPPPPLPDR